MKKKLNKLEKNMIKEKFTWKKKLIKEILILIEKGINKESALNNFIMKKFWI